MADQSDSDRYAKYANHEGPDEQTREGAMEKWCVSRGYASPSGGMVSNRGMLLGTPRRAKHNRRLQPHNYRA